MDRDYISNGRSSSNFFWRTDTIPLRDPREPNPYFNILFSKGNCRKVEVGDGKLFFFLSDYDNEDQIWISSLKINNREISKIRSRLYPTPLDIYEYMGPYTPVPERLPRNIICQCYAGNQEFLFGADRLFEFGGLYRWNVETKEFAEEWSGRISEVATLGNAIVILSAGKVIFLA